MVQHGINKVLAKVDAIEHKIHPDYSGIEENVSSLQMNDIAKVRVEIEQTHFLRSVQRSSYKRILYNYRQ